MLQWQRVQRWGAATQDGHEVNWPWSVLFLTLLLCCCIFLPFSCTIYIVLCNGVQLYFFWSTIPFIPNPPAALLYFSSFILLLLLYYVMVYSLLYCCDPSPPAVLHFLSFFLLLQQSLTNFLWKTGMIITITKTLVIICPGPRGLLLTYPINPYLCILFLKFIIILRWSGARMTTRWFLALLISSIMQSPPQPLLSQPPTRWTPG